MNRQHIATFVVFFALVTLPVSAQQQTVHRPAGQKGTFHLLLDVIHTGRAEALR